MREFESSHFSQPVRVLENFILFAEKAPPIAGFLNRSQSPHPPLSNKTPVFWRLAAETGEENHCVVRNQSDRAGDLMATSRLAN